MSTDLRSVLHSQDRDYPAGRLADVKRGETSDPGYPQPQAAEVESARLLANDARQALLAVGLSVEDIDRLADDFIAEDRGEATERFIDWASRVRRAATADRQTDGHNASEPNQSGSPGSSASSGEGAWSCSRRR